MSNANPRRLLAHLLSARGELARLLILTLLLYVVMAALNPGRFLSIRNFQSMAFQCPELGLLALAVMLPLVTGGIDLSIVSIANLCGVTVAMILTRGAGGDAPAGLWEVTGATAAGLLVGGGCGAVNGFMVGRLGLNPILVTLGTLQLFMGLAFVLTRGPAVSGFPELFIWLGNGSVLGVPMPLLLLVLISVSASLLLSRTRFGMQLYLLGTNSTAARYAGFNRPSLIFRTYLISGLVAATAGLLMISRTNSAKADYGASYLLQAILVAILGGVSPNGGLGTVRGLLTALLALQFIASGFSALRLSQFTQEFAWGALLLSVMVLNAIASRRTPKFLASPSPPTTPP